MRVDPAVLLSRLGIAYQRKGRALWAKCPLAHGPKADTDASWSIVADGSDKVGAHWCFGCKQGGGPADLVAAVLKVKLADAYRWMRDGGVVLETDLPAEVRVVVKMRRRAFRVPAEVVFAPLCEWPTPARDYVVRRGVTEEQAARWGLGYAVDGRLGGRVVVPFREASGAVVSYTARSFGRGVRYLEPREEEGADPHVVVGEHLWPARRERRALLLGEGYFDVAALERGSGGLPVSGLRGSPSPSERRWPSVVSKLSTFPLIVHAVDAGSAGARLYGDLRDALRGYSEVRPLFFECGDVAALSEQRGDGAVAEVLARVAPELDLPGNRFPGVRDSWRNMGATCG